jgi:hypothetical protein
MSKKTPEIEQLLAAYMQTAAKRIAKQNKRIAEKKAKAKELDLFEESIKKKITGVFRPAMEQLLSKLDKKVFRIKTQKLGFMPEILEQYSVTPLKEEHVNFWIAMGIQSDPYKAYLSYAYSVDDSHEHLFEKTVKPEDITEELIQKRFLFCLKKIAE